MAYGLKASSCDPLNAYKYIILLLQGGLFFN